MSIYYAVCLLFGTIAGAVFVLFMLSIFTQGGAR